MRGKLIGAIAFAALAVSGCETMDMGADQGAVGSVTPAGNSALQTSADSEALRSLQQEFNRTAGDRVFFDIGQDQPGARGIRILNDQVSWLQSHPEIEVIVEGHADETGSALLNMELGEKRADMVAAFLQGKGIAADRIRIVSYGETRPYAVPDPKNPRSTSSAALALNRRAVTILANFAGDVLTSPGATPPVESLQNEQAGTDNAAYPAAAPAQGYQPQYGQPQYGQAGQQPVQGYQPMAAGQAMQQGTEENPVVLAPEGIQPPQW